MGNSYRQQQPNVQGNTNKQAVDKTAYSQAKHGRSTGYNQQGQTANHANGFNEVPLEQAYLQGHHQTQQQQYHQPPVSAQPIPQVESTVNYGGDVNPQSVALQSPYSNADGQPFAEQQMQGSQSQDDNGYWNVPSQGLFMLNRVFVDNADIDELTGNPKVKVQGFLLVGKKSKRLSYYSIIEISPKQKNFQDMILQYKHLIESKAKVSCSMDVGLNFIGTKIKDGIPLVSLYFQLFWLHSMNVDRNKVINNPRPKKQ